jgi:hypothetical protein
MDKNIAAFLDTKAYTLAVTFQPSNDAPYHKGAQKEYTYVTNIPGIKVGDWVVVPTSVGTQSIMLPTDLVDIDDVLGSVATINHIHVHRGKLEVVRVSHVDATVDLAPNDTKAYGWVVSKIDLLAYSQLMDRNSQITAATTAAYRKSMQRSFAERILGDMDQADKDGLMKLLGK